MHDDGASITIEGQVNGASITIEGQVNGASITIEGQVNGASITIEGHVNVLTIVACDTWDQPRGGSRVILLLEISGSQTRLEGVAWQRSLSRPSAS